MDLAELSTRLDPLPFAARQRLLAATARSLAGSAELTSLLAELDARPGVTRDWAMLLATVAGDQAYLRAALTSPDLGTARAAVRYCARHNVHFDVVAATLPDAPLAWRQALYLAIRTCGATAWASELLPLVRVRFGDREAAVVLPAADADTVTALLPELDFAVTNLAALARRHPGPVLAHLRQLLTTASEAERAGVWHRYGPAITPLAHHDPARILDLLTHHGPVTGLPPWADRWLLALAKADPERLAAFLADTDRRIHCRPRRSLGHALRAASDTALAALARTMISDGNRFTTLLRRLPPARRAAVLAGALGERDIVAAGLPVSVLDVLPWPARHEHARRLLPTQPVAIDPRLTLAVTARLPWSEAEPVLRAQTARSVADERAYAYPLLIGAAAATRDPETVGAVLASLTRLANEQDPVRHQALQAIAALPPWLFRPVDLPDLEKLATDALQARDVSWMSRQAVDTLARNLVRHGAITATPAVLDCGLRVLQLSSGHNRTVSLYHLDRDLPHGAEHVVFEVLRPRIAADADVDRYDFALALAAGLRRRAWGLPDLQHYLGRAVTASAEATARRGITLWLEPPASRAERVATVFDGDPSTITVPAVAKIIGSVRTDLLDRVLFEPLDGRFVKAGIALVPIFHHGLRHWLPRHHARYAALLAELARSPRRIVRERVAAVSALGRVPGVGADAVRPFLADDAIPVVEAALAALAWTDRPDQVLGELLGYADTDRARVAVYAATRCARAVSPGALAAALRPVLAGRKVTSRKEAVRLLAEHRVPGAADTLLALWADPDLHRDVRRSIVSAVRWVLDDPRVWTVLAEAVAAPFAVARAVTEADPYTVAARHRARYGALVRAVADHPHPDTARLGLAAWPAWSAWDRDGTTALVTLIGDLTNTTSWRPTVDALLTAVANTADPAPGHAVLTTLTAAPEVAAPDADAVDRDLPGPQRLDYFLAELATRIDTAGEAVRAIAATLADAVAVDPALADHRADALALAVAALPRRDLTPPLRRIAAHADRPSLAWRTADRLADWLAGHDPGRPAMLTTAQQLTDTPTGALLALAIASQSGPDAGWPAPWRDLVRALRAHPDPDVRDRAHHTLTAPE